MKLAAPRRTHLEASIRGSAATLMRLGAVASIAGGALWLVSAALSLVLASGLMGGAWGLASVNEAIILAALAGTLGGTVALHLRQSPGYGSPGAAGFVLAASGLSLLLAGLVVQPVIGRSAGLDLVLGGSLLTAVLGFLLLGFATLRVGFLPQWCGALLAVGAPLAIAAGDYGGGLVMGVLWTAVGYRLISAHDVSAVIKARLS